MAYLQTVDLPKIAVTAKNTDKAQINKLMIEEIGVNGELLEGEEEVLEKDKYDISKLTLFTCSPLFSTGKRVLVITDLIKSEHQT